MDPNTGYPCQDHKEWLQSIERTVVEVRDLTLGMKADNKHAAEMVEKTLSGMDKRIAALEEWRKTRTQEIAQERLADEREKQRIKDVSQFQRLIIALLAGLWGVWATMHDHLLDWIRRVHVR